MGECRGAAGNRPIIGHASTMLRCHGTKPRHPRCGASEPSTSEREIGRAIRRHGWLGADVGGGGKADGRSGPLGIAERARQDRQASPSMTWCVLGAAVGLRMSVSSAYPDGPAVRDEAQVALLRRFRARIGPAWRWQLEVPMPIPATAVPLTRSSRHERADVSWRRSRRSHDLQAQLRPIRLKTRDMRHRACDCRRSRITTRNRRIFAGAADVVPLGFPVGSRAAIRSLSAGRRPPMETRSSSFDGASLCRANARPQSTSLAIRAWRTRRRSSAELVAAGAERAPCGPRLPDAGRTGQCRDRQTHGQRSVAQAVVASSDSPTEGAAPRPSNRIRRSRFVTLPSGLRGSASRTKSSFGIL